MCKIKFRTCGIFKQIKFNRRGHMSSGYGDPSKDNFNKTLLQNLSGSVQLIMQQKHCSTIQILKMEFRYVLHLFVSKFDSFKTSMFCIFVF